MKINFYVQEQTLSVDENYRIVEGSKNYLKARFYFTGEWCNLTKTAVFSTPDKQKVYHVLLQNNECFVPPEVIAKAGFSVSVFAGDTINTNPVTITVGESGFIPNVSPPEPTPSIYSQMINQFDEKLDSANEVLKEITSSNAVTQQQVTDHRTAPKLDHPDNSVTDAKIGVRTIADPNSSGTISGSLTTLLTTTAQAQRSEVAARKAADAALENNKLDKTQYASVSQPGVIMLYNKNGINRSGLVVYDDGSAVVNTKTERGVTRDGAGQIGINPATEAEITAGTDAYKPIVPATLSHAVQTVTGQLTGLETTDKSSFTAAINEVRRESINADFIKDVYGNAVINVTVFPIYPAYESHFDGAYNPPDGENQGYLWFKTAWVSDILNANNLGKPSIDSSLHDAPGEMDWYDYDGGDFYVAATLDLTENKVVDFSFPMDDALAADKKCLWASYERSSAGHPLVTVMLARVEVPPEGGELVFHVYNGHTSCRTDYVGDLSRLPLRNKDSIVDAIIELNDKIKALTASAANDNAAQSLQ